MKKLVMVLAAFALSSCAMKPIQLTQTFDEAEAQKYMKDGKNTIEASAVWREKNGHLQTCAGYWVYLYPATEYAKERLTHQFGEGKRGFRTLRQGKQIFAPDEAQFHKLSKKTVCDVDGKFTFENVADGDYYIVTNIIWGDPEYPDEQTEGGALMHKVSVKGGQKIKRVLSPYL